MYLWHTIALRGNETVKASATQGAYAIHVGEPDYGSSVSLIVGTLVDKPAALRALASLETAVAELIAAVKAEPAANLGDDRPEIET